MSRLSYCLAAALASLCLGAAPASAQIASPVTGHLVVVRLAVLKGGASFGFQPSAVSVTRGDTLRFVEDAGVMHNVRFKSHPNGAKLGGAAIGPYLTTQGQKYDLVIDGRFTNGQYDFVCDPHEMLGMHGTLTVGPAAP